MRETEQQRGFFRDLLDDHDAFVMQDGDEAVGAVYLARREQDVWLELVGVAPAHQGRGLGGEALRWVTERAGGLGGSTLLQGHRVNDAARRLYLRSGYERAGETETHHLLRYRSAGD